MYATVQTCSLQGLDGIPVNVEAEVLRGMTAFYIVGLPSASIQESKERIRSSFQNLKLKLPLGRIVVNLAPANDRKDGSQFDLPIAISLLLAMGKLPPDAFQNIAAFGELSLDGRLIPVSGALTMALFLRSQGHRRLLIPKGNLAECSVIPGVELLPLESLEELLSTFTNSKSVPIEEKLVMGSIENIKRVHNGQKNSYLDYIDVLGQPILKQAFMIAAAGGHNLLMIGPPGCGKTMSALRLPSILPPMSEEEMIESTGIASVSGRLQAGEIVTQRPFRTVHPSITTAGLLGGGVPPKPGEISMAHNGVLYLDEFAEFSRGLLDQLRIPMEAGRISLSRGNQHIVFPARFQLIASMNPCPCGHAGDPIKECRCKPYEKERYLSRISQPLLDRIDLHVEVGSRSATQSHKPDMSSEEMRKRVLQARRIQRDRYKKESFLFNADVVDAKKDQYLFMKPNLVKMLQKFEISYQLSNRAQGKVIKIARTLADLDGRGEIEQIDLLQAVQFRMITRKYWYGL